MGPKEIMMSVAGLVVVGVLIYLTAWAKNRATGGNNANGSNKSQN